MSSSPNGSARKPRRRQAKKSQAPAAAQDSMLPSAHAHATSLQSIEILPRTPRTPATARRGRAHASDDADDEVELSLLSESDRRAAASDMTLEEEQAYLSQADVKKAISSRDKRAMVLLTILCASPFVPPPGLAACR